MSVSEQDIWRAAAQMVKLYPDGAELAAAMRADKALDMGDMFNFDLWKRVAAAARELARQKPDKGEGLN